MTTQERKVMELALEALKTYHGYMEPLLTVFGGPRVPAEKSTTSQVEQAIKALEEALAKQEQGEPVAWMFQHEETGRIMFVEAQQLEWGFEKGNPRLKKIGPIYTTPQQRKPLTDEQAIIIKGSTCPAIDWNARHGVEMNNGERNEWLLSWFMAFKDAIEAAHGIKE